MLQNFHISSHWNCLQHVHSPDVQDARISAWNWHFCQMPPQSTKIHLHCAILQKGYLKERLWQTPIWITLAPPFNQGHHPGDGSGTWPLIEGQKELTACNSYIRSYSKNWAARALLCKVCDHTISAETNCFEHTCEHHPTFVGELSSGAVVTTLIEDSSDSIINCISDCNSLWF